MPRMLVLCLAVAGALTAACDASRPDKETRDSQPAPVADQQQVGGNTMTEGSVELATFGGGCFWCVEAVLEQLDGVADVTSGYMGGHVDNPTYEQVCAKTTGHIEVVQVTYDPSKVGYGTLLKWFFKSHDPTSRDRQGGDEGPQYRSAIFCHSAEHKQAARDAIDKIDGSDVFAHKIVTEVLDAQTFWKAEGYHQDFYRNNKEHGYCQVVISPKLDKLGLDK